jgi:hypothetical protein
VGGRGPLDTRTAITVPTRDKPQFVGGRGPFDAGTAIPARATDCAAGAGEGTSGGMGGVGAGDENPAPLQAVVRQGGAFIGGSCFPLRRFFVNSTVKVNPNYLGTLDIFLILRL